MTDRKNERTWAPVRFHAREGPVVTPELHDRVRQIEERQAADSARFADAADHLLARLRPEPVTIIAMTCDHRFGPLVENWVASCVHHDIDVRSATVVFPTDVVTRDRVESLGLVTYFDDDSESLAAMTDSAQYGDLAWTDYMFHQNWVIEQLLTLRADVLFQDVDVVWRHDPVPVLQDRARIGIDVQAMYDGPNPRFQPLYANTGFMYLRNSPATHTLWDEVIARHDMVGYYRSQQEALNVILAAHAHRGLTVDILDEDHFANGHRYCGSRVAPDDPWVVHHSWTSNLDEKLVRYEANGHWYLDSDQTSAAWPSFRPPPRND